MGNPDSLLNLVLTPCSYDLYLIFGFLGHGRTLKSSQQGFWLYCHETELAEHVGPKQRFEYLIQERCLIILAKSILICSSLLGTDQTMALVHASTRLQVHDMESRSCGLAAPWMIWEIST